MIQKEINDSKCRLCLTDLQSEYSTLSPLINKNPDYNGMTLSTKIMICLSLPVQQNDPLSEKICRPCEREVIHFYSFRERCHRVYYTLLLHQNDFPIVHDIEEDEKNNGDDEEQLCDTQSDKEIRDDGSIEEIASKTSVTLHEEFSINYNNIDGQHDVDDDHSRVSETIERYEKSGADQPPENSVLSISDLPDVTEDEVIPNNHENKVDVLGYVEESMSYKCFHCDKLFPDLDTATKHCMKCSNIGNGGNTDIQSNDKKYKDIIETIEYINDDSTNDEEKIDDAIDTDTNNYSTAPEISDNKSIPKCRKHCRHTKCRRSVRRREKITHSCPQCGKAFASACLLKRHTTVHTGERPYECDTCGRRFSQVGALNFHKKFHVNPPYSCKICKKPFMRPSDMEKHMRTHTGEKPFSCQICQKQFAQTTAVQQHERIHTGAKPYVCEICGKAFSQSANKRKHVLIHKEGKKPHVCKTCGRSFSDPSEMELHKAGHGGGRPRECDYCGDRFRKLSEISDHIRRYHTFERPHKCAFCPKAFYALYSLKQHVMIHTGQKPYACVRCDHKFTQKGNLSKHYTRKHPDYSYEDIKEADHDNDCDDEEDDEEEVNSDVEKSVDVNVVKNENGQVDELEDAIVLEEKVDI